MKYINEIRRRFNDPRVPVFRSSELRLLGINTAYQKLLLHNMLKKGEIKRVAKGAYTFHDTADVVCFAFMPAYYGLEDALSIRHISDQATNPIVVTVRNVRQGERTFDGKKYLVYRIDKRLFFGYGLVQRGGMWLPVSDVEKTLIDMVYFKIGIRDELWHSILKIIDKGRLYEYLARCNDKTRKRVEEELAKHGSA
ncbi:MAG: type IV toxin-antitoxin system AbiEi family antitoxin domain-containing protein [Candidatus Micrarchaeia archaeon]